jgi:hypothetical protein
MPDLRNADADLDAALARIARVTDSLDAHPALAESVLETIGAVGAQRLPDADGRSTDEVIETTARLTADLCPSAGLADEVMAALGSVAPRSRVGRSLSAVGIARAGRSALLVAAAVAAISVGYASYAEQALDSEVMAAVDFVEASE